MHYRPNREPLIGSLVLMISSSLISAFAQEMGRSNGLWAIMVSRILLGMTRGNVCFFCCVLEWKLLSFEIQMSGELCDSLKSRLRN